MRIYSCYIPFSQIVCQQHVAEMSQYIPVRLHKRTIYENSVVCEAALTF